MGNRPRASAFPMSVPVTGSQKWGRRNSSRPFPPITRTPEEQHKWQHDRHLGRAVLAISSYQFSGFQPAVINLGVRKWNIWGLWNAESERRFWSRNKQEIVASEKDRCSQEGEGAWGRRGSPTQSLTPTDRHCDMMAPRNDIMAKGTVASWTGSPNKRTQIKTKAIWIKYEL